MAHNTLGRRLFWSVRNPFQCTTSPSSRAFATSARCRSERAPAIGDMDSHGAEAFAARQREFRERVKSAKEKADSQSSALSSSSDFSTSSALSSRVSRGVLHDTSDAQQSSIDDTVAPDSSSNLGEAREAARRRDEGESEAPKKKGAFSSLIYGTEEGREHDREMERSFSQVLARGKYVHSIVFHEVKPDRVEDYVELVGGWYPKVAGNPDNKVNLVGSWRTEVGDCDTFVHIWEYQKYHGYHDSLHTIQHLPGFDEFDHKLKSMIHSKKTSLMQEFSFWPTTPPRKLGGVFELRSYELHPGNLLEWETHWRRGLQARKEVMEGVGAWFVQIGELNTVHHLWQFADLEERKNGREQSWAVEGWSDTVHRTVPLIQTMRSRIMIPMPWSPIS